MLWARNFPVPVCVIWDPSSILRLVALLKSHAWFKTLIIFIASLHSSVSAVIRPRIIASLTLQRCQLWTVNGNNYSL